MIRLESFGDNLKKDDYECHSRFKRAVNFFNGHCMVALVDRRVGPGPNHLVISGIDPQKVRHVGISADELLLDDHRFPFASSYRYDSSIDLSRTVDGGRFRVNLEYFEHDIRRSAAPQSLAFLLGQKHRLHGRSTLERLIAARAAEGSKLIFGQDFLAGIRMLKGLGFGLTPSGDDFIGGVLLALHCGQRIFNRDFSRTIQSACRLASGKNPFSNTMFAYASSGRATGKIKDLLAAIIYGGEKKVCRCTKELRTIGHSSGIDFGVGLLLTFKKLDRSKGEKWW